MRFHHPRLVLAALAFACLPVAPALAQHVKTPEPPQPAEIQPIPRAAPMPRLAAREWRTFDRAVELQLRDVAATVIIRPEERNNIAVAVINPGPLRDPELRRSGRRLVIDGKLRRQIESCRNGRGEHFEVTIARVGRLTSQRLPIIEIRTPEDVSVNANGALRMHIGRAENAEVRLEGCGEADIVGVDDTLDLTVSGYVDARVYEVDEAEVRVAGEGDVIMGVVHDGLTAAIAGPGNLTAARVDGDTNIAVQGQGDVTIRSGRADVMSVVIAGTGDVTHNGSAERLDAVIVGAGDVRIRRVEGEVSRRIIGGGDVIVGGMPR